MNFEVKYLIGPERVVEPFPTVMVFESGLVTTESSYFSSSGATYTPVSNGDHMNISDDLFKEAKKIYYRAVDPSYLYDEKNRNPSEFISIDDIVDSLPDSV